MYFVSYFPTSVNFFLYRNWTAKLASHSTHGLQVIIMHSWQLLLTMWQTMDVMVNLSVTSVNLD